MTDYRLFFLGSDGAIEARQDFCAPDDQAALQIMDILSKACADTHHGVMLWQGIRRIYESGVKLPAGSRAGPGGRAKRKPGLAVDAQQCVIDCEEALLNSHWRLAKSKMLLEATNAMRQAGQQQASRQIQAAK